MLSSRTWAVGLILVATESVCAPPTESIPASVSEPIPLAWGPRIDAWHDALYFAVQGALRRWDARLAREEVAETDEVSSPFRLEIDLTSIENDNGTDLRGATRFDIDLQLPQLERRLRLFLTTDDLSETAADLSEDLRGGLRFGAFPGADFEIGIKIDAPPVAFAALRWGEEYRRGDWLIHPFAKVFIDSSQGPGLGAALVLDRWQDKNFWRSSTALLGLPRRSRAEWTQSWVWARPTDVLREGRPLARIGSRDIVHGWGVELIVSGEERRVEEKKVALFFKRPVQSDWLFVSLRPFWRSSREPWQPGIGPDQGPWQDDTGVTLGLDMLFWGPAGQSRSAPK